MKKVIAIDCDDVIVPSAPHIVSSYNDTYGTKVDLNDFYGNDPKAWGATSTDIVNRRVDEYLQSEEFQKTAPFVEAIDTIHSLSDKYELHVVTGRPDYMSVATKSMLEAHFPGLFRSVEFTSYYGKKPRSKADVCERLGVELLIDDHIHHAEVVAQRGIDVMLFGDYPWNQAEQLPANIRRVSGWGEVGELLLSPSES